MEVAASSAFSPPSPPELPTWQHAAACLRAGLPVTLLLVVSSSGSSPGRQGFKMSVALDSLQGSIGGGIMEHKFVELARSRMAAGAAPEVLLREQVHRAEAPHHRSGMICSGEQTVVLLSLQAEHLPTLATIITHLQRGEPASFRLSADGRLQSAPGAAPAPAGFGPATAAQAWHYTETLGFRDQLTIIGGGHVSLALAQLMTTLDFHVTVLDDRAELNTFRGNPFAHAKRVVDYAAIAGEVPSGPHHYVVIMTIGYRTDAVVLRQLLASHFAYLGMMGSQAKIAELRRTLHAEGYPEAQLARVAAPIGLPIHSRTPAEIAISIAAQLIQVRNASAAL